MVLQVVRCCDDNLDETLLEQLNGFSECGNVMVTTNSTLKSQHVTKVCCVTGLLIQQFFCYTSYYNKTVGRS